MRSVYREEKKFLISVDEFLKTSHTLTQVLREDAHNNTHGYLVRSLYFDTLYDDDFSEKIAGTDIRRKIRLRCYNPRSEFAMLEMKQKQGKSQLKRSLRVVKEDAEKLMEGDYSPLLRYSDSFAAECYALMVRKCYRPKVIVQYNRKAFIAKENKIRVTFDSNIEATKNLNLFSEEANMIPIISKYKVILEVKYNGFLLSYIQSLINSVNRNEISASKYVLARQYGY